MSTYREVILSFAAAILIVNGQPPTPCLTEKDCRIAQRYYGGTVKVVPTPEDAGFLPGWDAGIDRVRGKGKR